MRAMRSPTSELSTPVPLQSASNEQSPAPQTHDLATSVTAPNVCEVEPAPLVTRKKGKQITKNDDLKLSIDNLNKLLSSSMSQQDSKLAVVIATITEIKEQNENIQKTVDFLLEENSDLKKKIITMDSEKKDLLLHIKSLEEKVENSERNARATGIELRNFTQKQGETKTDLSEIVMKIGQKIGTPIQRQEIKDIFRTNSKAENKPIILEFTTVIKKEEFLDSLKKFKRDSNGQLESSSLGISGQSTKVFFSETLTIRARRLFTLTRDHAKSNLYKFCWTSHGFIYLRKGDGQPAIRITGEEDLRRLKTDK